MNTYAYVRGNPVRFIDYFGLDATDDKLLTREILDAFLTAYEAAGVGSKNAHEEGGIAKNNVMCRVPRGTATGIVIPRVMPNGEIPDLKFHVHQYMQGDPVPGRSNLVYGDPAIASTGDRENALPYSRNYIVTPTTMILRYDSTGVVEKLGTIHERLSTIGGK